MANAELRNRLRYALASEAARDQLMSQIGFVTFGTDFYVDADNGNDNNDGLSPDTGFKTVLKGYDATTSGNHDIVWMSGNAAHAIATELAISKSRVHFVGTGGNGRWEGQRTRWEMGVTTGSEIAIVQNTGVGNTFSNIKMRSTDTNTSSLYTFADGGEFTILHNVSLEHDSLLTTDACSELLANGDTSLYVDCSFGNLIYLVNATRAVVLFTRETITGKVARSVRFIGCSFFNKTADATSSHVTATTNDIERSAIFENCIFWTAVLSTATQTVVFSIASALTDGMVLLKDCAVLNVTGVCATSLGVYTTSPAPAAAGTEAILVAAS